MKLCRSVTLKLMRNILVDEFELNPDMLSIEKDEFGALNYSLGMLLFKLWEIGPGEVRFSIVNPGGHVKIYGVAGEGKLIFMEQVVEIERAERRNRERCEP